MELHPVLNIQWLNQTQQAKVDAAFAAGIQNRPAGIAHEQRKEGGVSEIEEAKHRARREQQWGAEAPLHVRDNMYNGQHDRVHH
jgi:hypothetical protein